MSGRGRRTALAVMGAALALAGCAGKRLHDGVYHASEGYRVRVPGPAWAVAEDSRAGLELRHRSRPAGMLVNAVCDWRVARRRPAILERHLLLGVRDRRVLEHGEVALNGTPAAHTLVEGRMKGTEEPVRIEAYTLARGRCVYDLLYAAPPADFAETRGDFARFVESFSLE